MTSELQASAHAVLRDHHAFWNFWLTLGALVPSAALLCLVLVTDEFARRAFHLTPDGLKFVNAAVALFAFICVLVQLVWKPDSREAAHAHAVDHYSNAIPVSEFLHDEHGAIHIRGLPPIRHASFVRLKQLHLQKAYVSRRLELDPWMVLPKRGDLPNAYVPLTLTRSTLTRRRGGEGRRAKPPVRRFTPAGRWATGPSLNIDVKDRDEYDPRRKRVTASEQ